MLQVIAISPLVVLHCIPSSAMFDLDNSMLIICRVHPRSHALPLELLGRLRAYQLPCVLFLVMLFVLPSYDSFRGCLGRDACSG